MASSGQTTPQAPQLMQSSGSMTWRSLRSPVIAAVGQRRMQAVHPVQFSVMMKGIVRDPTAGDKADKARLAQEAARCRAERNRSAAGGGQAPGGRRFFAGGGSGSVSY